MMPDLSPAEVRIAPTCVPLSPRDLQICGDSVRAFASAVHIDIDDNIFAPFRTWPYAEDGSFGDVRLFGVEGMVVDVHLMVAHPRDIGRAFARAGASCIIGHREAFSSAGEASSVLREWKEAGAVEVGLGLLFDTPTDDFADFVAECDVVHLMSISTIGTQGIPYNPDAPRRIAEFHRRFPHALLSVDGGVSLANIAELVRAGARRFGVGSAISRAPDPARAYQELHAAALAACT